MMSEEINSDGLNNLISEDVITDEEDCDASNLLKLEELNGFNLRLLTEADKCDLELANESHQLTSLQDDMANTDSLSDYLRLDFNNFPTSLDENVDQSDKYCQPVLQIGEKLENLKSKTSANDGFTSGNNYTTAQTFERPKSKVKFDSISRNWYDLHEKGGKKQINEMKQAHYSDNTELENKINDTLLDMLQGEILEDGSRIPKDCKPEEKQADNTLKFVTIFPTESNGKIIHLMVKGKTCRSKQSLNEFERRIVNRILRQENILGRKNESYKNVYYDAETDKNIRYEVRQRTLSAESNSMASFYSKIKKKKVKFGSRSVEENDKPVTNEGKFIWNKVARTRFGRISRPPRHVVRDYKQLKNSETIDDNNEECENTENYFDHGTGDDDIIADENKTEESKKQENFLYGPLEPNKRQFSSLSICPTCGKVYLGYRRMAIHFQKYPDHKNEDLLKQLLKSKKPEVNDDNGVRAEGLMVTDGYGCIKDEEDRKNGPLNQKRKLNRKLRSQNLHNPATCIQQLLSHFGTKEIVKYAGPIVAGVLNSWEYVLMRTKQLKNTEEPLLLSLLKEIKLILNEIQSLSSHVLKPLLVEDEITTDRVMIEQDDLLQYVLGMPPGNYKISDADVSINSSQMTTESPSISQSRSIIPSVNDTNVNLYDTEVAKCSQEISVNVLPGVELCTEGDSNSHIIIVANGLVNTNICDERGIPAFTLDNDLTASNLPVQNTQPVIANEAAAVELINGPNMKVIDHNFDNISKFDMNSEPLICTDPYMRNMCTMGNSLPDFTSRIFSPSDFGASGSEENFLDLNTDDVLFNST